ncbi:MAG: hypothetical protein ACE145_19260 [Terriglobia bacterium]
MLKASGTLRRTAIIVSIVGLTALAAWAATAVNVTASLATSCSNCETDVAGKYSLLPDEFGAYSPSSDGRIQSQILTNNSVYTLDTTMTLSNGVVGPSTRTVLMHFYSSVECGVVDPTCKYPNNILPPCWGGQYDQDQAVNWSIFAPTSFLRMSTGAKYSGMARLNFNVRNADCDRQINRFRLEWPTVCITRTGSGSWTVTSQACTLSTQNVGEAHLEAYGGTKKNTVDYGDWRMPFFLTLVK